jgi:hypothetical protein
MKKYINPKDVTSPKDAVKSVEVLYDDPNSIAIAKIKWFDHFVIGIRWNASYRELEDQDKASGKKICVGNPVSRGFPTWFILPKEIVDPNSSINKVLREIKFDW